MKASVDAKLVAWAGIFSISLSGCSLIPFPAGKIEDATVRYRSDAGPWKAWTETESVLACLGDKLREQRIQPITIGFNVEDTTGKTGVNQGMLAEAALQKIAARGNGIGVSSWGTGPVGPGARLVSPQDNWIATMRPRLAETQTPPDWTIQGGVVAAEPTFLQQQDRYGLAARDVDFAKSGTNTVTVADVAYSIKDTRRGIYFPGATVSMRVAYQSVSASLDTGAYVAFRVDGRSSGAGLRFGRSRSVSQSAADILRVGVESAIAFLLADRYHVDLAECASYAAPVYAIKDKQVARFQELPEQFEAMSESERVSWAQDQLNRQGYDAGSADGVVGPRTRAAIQRYQRDQGMYPDARIGTTLLVQLARTGAGNPPVRGTGALNVSLDYRPYNPTYFVGMPLRAAVTVPTAGRLWCYLETPTERATIFPVIDGRPNSVSAYAATLLPDNNSSGPHPSITVTEPGPHRIYCAEVGNDIARSLPPGLRAGGNGAGFRSMDEIARIVKVAAGAHWIGDGSVTFVAQAAPRAPARQH